MKLEAVTWLDFRADDLSRARDFIRSLQEEGVIDELGFSPCREDSPICCTQRPPR